MFHNRAKIKWDSGIDETLKDIAETVGLQVRARLLDRSIELPQLQELLDQEFEEDVLGEALGAIKHRSEGLSNATYAHANLRLFAWLVSRGRLDDLEAFPALTLDDEHVVSLAASEDSEPAMVPITRWPAASRIYGHLFPKRQILSEQYISVCADDHWRELVEAGLLLPGPIYATEGTVRRFLPDEPFPDAEADAAHESLGAVPLMRIAFLGDEHGGVIETSRKSAKQAASFLSFLVTVVCSTDLHALEAQSADCSCGKAHRYLSAEWVVALRSRRCVPIGHGRALPPTADTLAVLLQQHAQRTEILRDAGFARLMSVLGISVADVTLRAVASSEQQRADLAQAFTGLLDASGGDADKIRALAEEMRECPGLYEQIASRREVRARIRANQAIGASVESLLTQVLRDTGMSVRRTGVGSDYEVDMDVIDDSGEVLFVVQDASDGVLIEVKATTIAAVRMTRTQAERAVVDSNRFVLCVVPVRSDCALTLDNISRDARFVNDIGARLSLLTNEVRRLELIREAATLQQGDVEVLMTASDVRFRVAAGAWEHGLNIQEFAAHVASHRSVIMPVRDSTVES